MKTPEAVNRSFPLTGHFEADFPSLSLPQYGFEAVLSSFLSRSGWLYIGLRKGGAWCFPTRKWQPQGMLEDIRCFYNHLYHGWSLPSPLFHHLPLLGLSSSYSILNPPRFGSFPLPSAEKCPSHPTLGSLLIITVQQVRNRGSRREYKFDLRQAAVASWSRVIRGHQIKGSLEKSLKHVERSRLFHRGVTLSSVPLGDSQHRASKLLSELAAWTHVHILITWFLCADGVKELTPHEFV